MTIRTARASRRPAPPRLSLATLLLAVALAPAALAAAAVPAGAPPAAARPDSLGASRVPFGLGERLVFNIDYGPVRAGEGVLEVQGLVNSSGRPAFQIESRATSNRVFSAVYKVRDRIVSHLDVERLHTLFFSKRLREGSYRQNLEIVFDQQENKARYADGRVFDTVPGVQDELSAFYWARTLDFEVGGTYGVMAHTSRKDYELKVIVHRRESVKVPAGTFDCWVIEPVMQGEGLFQHEGKLTIWLTADRHRIPVLMRTKVKVGSIDVSLSEYELGRPVPADLSAAALPAARPAAGAADEERE